AGIQPHVKGYQYIKEATWIGFEEIDALSAFTKWIYPAIAKKYQTSVAGVERSIRHAIQSAWNQNQAVTSTAMFRFSRLKKSTNSEFISAIVNALKIESKLTVYN